MNYGLSTISEQVLKIIGVANLTLCGGLPSNYLHRRMTTPFLPISAVNCNDRVALSNTSIGLID